MSAQYPVLNSDDHGFDRRYLAASEVAGDGEGTTMSPTSQRVSWWYYLNQKRLGPSSSSAMAATTAQLRYAGETRPEAVKKRFGKTQKLTPNTLEQKEEPE